MTSGAVLRPSKCPVASFTQLGTGKGSRRGGEGVGEGEQGEAGQ
jgi:hypothetical protein